jgi:phage-related minor tail protein
MRGIFPGAFAAKGAYFSGGQANFAQNSIKPFAMGGIVTKPTFFKYADGGAGRFGLMGEAGPEAIMPLKRGPNGRLGVDASGIREAFVANRNALGNASGQSDSAFAENREALSTVSSLERERLVERVLSSGSGSTEIKYSRVGSGDLPFVTEEDMLQASRLAAQEGARLGQQRTLAALKNNPGTRRGVGI